ncbi:Lipase member M, partial [Aptenodytes patagonicus]
SQIIHFHGYRSEDHQVLTDDGYLLAVNRIPGGSRLPVLLQHGLVLDGSNWVSNFPNSSLGFILMDTGYNVWIGNSRGNSWSRQHLNLSVDQEEFWDFSFHEMAVYDLPAMVGFILRQTRQEKLFYDLCSLLWVFFSGFIAFSSMPQLAESFKMFFVVDPAYTLHMGKGPVLSLFYLPGAIIKVIFGRKGALLGREQTAALARVCSCWLLDRVCTDRLFLIGGFNENNLNMVGTFPYVYLSHFPDYASTKNLLHWGQVTCTLSVHSFVPGLSPCSPPQTSPPFYRVEHMMVPTTLWSGREDRVTFTAETQCLLPCITNLVRHEHFPDWNCWDHIWGLDTPQHMYRQMVTLMIHER